jgi:hypothetical protein
MATFTLKLDAYTLRKLTEAARKAGVSPERMAGMMLEAWVHDAVAPGPERAQSGVDEPARAWADAVGDVDGPDPHTTPAGPGGPVVELVEPSRSRFAEMAKDGGVPQEVLAAAVLDSRLFDHDDFEWPEGGDPREDNAANYDLNEVGRPWSEVRPEMEAYLERKLAERK